MPVPTKGALILKRAEEELRAVIHEALEQGNYQDVTDLASLADSLARLHGPSTRQETTADKVGESVDAASEGRRTGRSTAARAFPRFQRDGDKLVKIAWSKKNRAEYEHRAPRDVVDALIEKIRKKKGEGARFEAPEVLPLKDKAGREVPSYQSYLALAWLRQEGIVIKHGRDRYALKPAVASRERLAELWEALPQK